MNWTVLVVDDEAMTRDLLRMMLQRANFSVLEAEDGLDALEKVKQTLPDLIVLDVMMPNMNGYAVCEAIRAEKATAHIPVIMLSARTDDRSAQHSLDAGATLCLQKPLGFRDLVGSVERLLQHREFASAALAISAD